MQQLIQPLLISVRGMSPAPAVPADQLAKERMWKWQRSLYKEARAMYDINSIHGITLDTIFKVAIVFRLTQLKVRKIDLDNLAKPVLDALFKPNYQIPEDRGGALFNVDDANVFKLTIEKIIVPKGEEGADINITWE